MRRRGDDEAVLAFVRAYRSVSLEVVSLSLRSALDVEREKKKRRVVSERRN
jgi:hypothetical protein